MILAAIAAAVLAGTVNNDLACHTPTCGGPDTPQIHCEDCGTVVFPIGPPPLSVVGGPEGMQVIILGGIDPSGNARATAVDDKGHLKCSPFHNHRARYIRNFPVSVRMLETGILVDEQGRAVCSVTP